VFRLLNLSLTFTYLPNLHTWYLLPFFLKESQPISCTSLIRGLYLCRQ